MAIFVEDEAIALRWSMLGQLSGKLVCTRVAGLELRVGEDSPSRHRRPELSSRSRTRVDEIDSVNECVSLVSHRLPANKG